MYLNLVNAICVSADAMATSIIIA